jgi:hypothetical protein
MKPVGMAIEVKKSGIENRGGFELRTKDLPNIPVVGSVRLRALPRSDYCG